MDCMRLLALKYFVKWPLVIAGLALLLVVYVLACGLSELRAWEKRIMEAV